MPATFSAIIFHAGLKLSPHVHGYADFGWLPLTVSYAAASLVRCRMASRTPQSPECTLQGATIQSNLTCSLVALPDGVTDALVSWMYTFGWKSVLTWSPRGAAQGELEVTTEKGTGKGRAAKAQEDVVERVPFLILALDLPPPPLFKDIMEKNIIPQVRGRRPGASKPHSDLLAVC